MMRLPWIMIGFVCVGVLATSAHGQQPHAGATGRDCSVCHLSWTSDFEQPGRHPLIEDPGRLVAGEEEVCLGCHDGSVGDDRLAVWIEHGHRRGIEPPEGMQVPEELPLEDGKLVCRTCHSAHGGSGAETLASTFFIRAAGDQDDLCVLCHSGYEAGPTHGAHPLTELPEAMPQTLHEAGAETAADDRTMVCQSCHKPHGRSQDHLLVMAADTSQLCLQCHSMIDPHRWSEATVNDHHPVNGTVATTQPGTGTGNHTLQATDETKPGCLSCHMMHRSPAPQRLLKHAYEGSELCHECHAQQQQVTDTPHNLAHSAPDVQNLHGVTAVQGGSCSACHGIHDPARKAVKVVGDPNGQCVTCHRNDGCANAVHETEGSHPLVFSDDQLPGTMSLPTEPIADANRKQVACNACHRPHDNSLTRFLQQKPDALCGQCHSDHVQQVKGGHDIASTHPDATNATGFNADQTGTCGFCHGFHRGARPSLWSASDDPVDRPNDVCLHCHQESALAADMIAGAVLHPQGQYTEQTLSRNKLSLPLFDQQLHQQQQGQLACATCHDVHANSQINPAMLRANPARGQTFRWCGSCHEQADRLTATLHDERFIQAHGSEQDGHFKSGFCQPCHAVHAPAGVDPKKIDAMLTAPVGNDSPPGAGQCLGCHQEAGGASAVRVTVHPDLPMHNLSEPGTPGYLPLADAAGSLHGGGQITCRTCHLPHGQHGEPALDLTDPSEISENQLRGLRWMVRPFTAPNLCTGCHGMTGLTYYLYWHQPEKRLQPTTMSFSPVKSE